MTPQAGQTPADQAGNEGFFLDPDTATSLGDVNYMRRANTIRRTFPGNADSPGSKELVQEVDSMGAKIEKASEGLPVQPAPAARKPAARNQGVPKPVKKTFASPLNPDQLAQRLRGSAVKPTNVASGGEAPLPRKPITPAPSAEAQGGTPSPGLPQKPGSIDPFKGMARDITG